MPNDPNNPYLQHGEATFNEARGFVGVDLYTDAQDVPGNYLLQADNFVNRMGVLYSRQGKQGLYGGSSTSSSSSSSSSSSGSYINLGATSPAIHGNPLYALGQLTDGSGNTWVIYVCGGKLYKELQGSGVHTELLSVTGQSYNLNSQVTDAAVYGSGTNSVFMHIADGAHGTIRVGLNGGYPAYAMVAPTTAPVTYLTNTALFTNAQGGNNANWSFDGQATPYGNIAPNGGNLRGAGWVHANEDPNWPGNLSVGSVNLAWGGSYVTLVGGTGSAGGLYQVAALSGNAGVWPSRFRMFVTQAWYQITNPSDGIWIQPVVSARLTPFDSSGNNQLGGSITVPFITDLNKIEQRILDFNFSGLQMQGVAQLQITLINTSPGHNTNCFVGPIAIYPVSVQNTFITGANYVTVIPSVSGGPSGSTSSSSSAASSSSPSGGLSTSGIPPDLGNILDYQGTSLEYTFPTGAKDLSTIDRIVIGLNNAASWGALSLAFYLIQSSGSSSSSSSSSGSPATGTLILADNGVAIANDLSSLECDISTLSLNQRRNIIGFKLLFLSDPTWIAPYYGLGLGPIYQAGNLSVGDAPYNYAVAELVAIDGSWQVSPPQLINNSNLVESNPSPSSVSLVPIPTQAEALVYIPADCPKNTQSPNNAPLSGLYYGFYRLGGVWPDWRLIAIVPASYDVTMGADATNPYYGWDHTNRVITDNTPDLWLTQAILMSYSRDPMPANAQAIAAFQGRLVAAVGNTVYVSWLGSADTSAGLMTTLVSNSNDPNVGIAGWNAPVNSDPSDTIVRMIPFGTPITAGNQFGGGLLILCKRSVCLLQGNDSSDTSTGFRVQTYDYQRGVGLVAFRGVTRVNAEEIVFAGPDRLHVFPPKNDSPIKDLGRPIQPALYPTSPFVLQNPSAFANLWMQYHDTKLFVGAPNPGDSTMPSATSVTWVYDFITHGWTRWTGMNVTSAISLSPSVATGSAYQLYLFGGDGQLYLMNGTADYANALSAQTGIPILAVAHGMRPGFFYRYKLHPLYYRWGRLEWIEFEVTMIGSLLVRAAAYTPYTGGAPGITYGTPIPGASYSKSFNLTGGGRGVRMSMPTGAVEGEYIEVQLSGTITQQAIIRGIRGWVSQTSEETGG